jgi:hypothetical protein
MVRPFLLAGFDPRQIRPRLPAPRQARFRASPRQARPDYRRQAWGTPLACGLKPSGNRTVKTLHRSVFSQSSGRAVSRLAARFPERFSPIVFGLHKVTPTPARHRNATRCFHQSSSCSGAGHQGQKRGRGGTCGTGRKGRALRPPMNRAVPGTGHQQASGDCPGGCRQRIDTGHLPGRCGLSRVADPWASAPPSA